MVIFLKNSFINLTFFLKDCFNFKSALPINIFKIRNLNIYLIILGWVLFIKRYDNRVKKTFSLNNVLTFKFIRRFHLLTLNSYEYLMIYVSHLFSNFQR